MLLNVPPPRHIVSAYSGPRGFCWLEPGLLGGTQQPGLCASATADIEALRRVGTDCLVTLTEAPLPCAAELAASGIQNLHFPIPDRGAPDSQAAYALCETLSGHLGDGKVVVLHCRAGKGRTGTMLAALLIYGGMDADAAIDAVRLRHRAWIESDTQIAFLSRFGTACRSPLGS